MDLRVQGNFKGKGGAVDFNLPIITFTENNIYFYYNPALDLSGYGNTDEEAKASFDQTISQFLDYGTNKKTLFSELEKLGWVISKKIVCKAPSLIDMVNSNDYLAEIFEEKQYKKFNQSVSIPLYA